RFGDSRRLHEIEATQTPHKCSRLRGEPGGDTRYLQTDDLDLALERRVVDPMEEHAALERVVKLARAIRGEDNDRPARAANGADLRDRDLEIRQYLEQECLEL